MILFAVGFEKLKNGVESLNFIGFPLNVFPRFSTKIFPPSSGEIVYISSKTVAALVI